MVAVRLHGKTRHHSSKPLMNLILEERINYRRIKRIKSSDLALSIGINYLRVDDIREDCSVGAHDRNASIIAGGFDAKDEEGSGRGRWARELVVLEFVARIYASLWLPQPLSPPALIAVSTDLRDLRGARRYRMRIRGRMRRGGSCCHHAEGVRVRVKESLGWLESKKEKSHRKQRNLHFKQYSHKLKRLSKLIKQENQRD